MTGIIQRPDTHILILLLGFIVAGDVALVIRINNVPVARIGNNKSALATAGLKPIFTPDHAAFPAARNSDVGVILLSPINVIRKGVVDRDVIELRSRLIVQ